MLLLEEYGFTQWFRTKVAMKVIEIFNGKSVEEMKESAEEQKINMKIWTKDYMNNLKFFWHFPCTYSIIMFMSTI